MHWNAKKVGLIMSYHNKLRDGVSDLAGKAFTPAKNAQRTQNFHRLRCVGGEPQSQNQRYGGPTTRRGGEGDGELLIQDLWTHGTEIIHDIRVVNTDAISYQSKTTKKCLETAGCKYKKKYLHACIDKRKQFTPFIAAVDSLLGAKSEAMLKHTVIRLSQNWKHPYLRTSGYLTSRV